MNPVTVLAYHSVGECASERDPHRLVLPVATFEAQLEFLARSRTVVALSDIVENKVSSSKPAVALTFDDGYRGVLTHAAPILERYGFPAVCFVPTKWVGMHNEWDPFGPGDCRLDVLDEDELHRLESMGVTIESHAHSHVDLAAMTDEEARADLRASQERFAQIMGRRARYLAYPYGFSAPPSLCRAAEAAGFEAAFTVNRPAGPSTFARARVVVRREDGLRFFGVKTSGRYLALRHSWMGRTAYRAARPWVVGRKKPAGV